MMLGSENGRLINYPNRNCSINELQVNPSLFFWILDEKQQRFEMCWDVWGSKCRKTSYRGIPLWIVRRGHSSMILPAPCKLGCAGGPCLVKLWRTMALGLAEERILLEDVQAKCCTTHVFTPNVGLPESFLLSTSQNICHWPTARAGPKFMQEACCSVHPQG